MAMLIKVIKFYARFTLSFTAIGYWWRSLFWSRLNPDFAGRVWLVTGASGGLGKAIVEQAAAAGATVIAVARSRSKLDGLIAACGPKAQIVPMVADLALQSETEDLIGRLAADGRKIDVLVNNVGMLANEFALTSEGRESSFATNILNHYLLTERLIEKDMLKNDGVVINMSSGGMYNAPLLVERMNVTDPKRYAGVFAYAVHKRGQAELTKYWHAKYGGRGMKFYVMHPGWADTAGVERSLPRFYKILNLVLRNGRQGTETAIWLAATKPACEPGAFWFDRAVRTSHAYPATQVTKNTPEELAAYLSKELGMA
ncbi:MAG: SDR family NAD(P)-dependent oxidoreductase [Rhodobacteraceae bacterium]|nr:SDR family NAD(P)-dependent oxidoreductase [Paracoccaceae bacterium]